MRTAIPSVLYGTMKKEIVYDALRETHYISNLPAYVEDSYWFPKECTLEVQKIPLALQADIIWCALEDAHNNWRSQLETKELLLTEECSVCLNAFTRLELAGPVVYNIWAGHFYRLFNRVGFMFEHKLDVSEYEAQMTQMEELDFGRPPLLDSIFVINRRRFIQGQRIADYGDLLGYVSEMQNDVFNVVRGPVKCPSAGNTALRIARAMYNDDGAKSMQFRVARQIAAANGNDKPPLSW